MKKLSKEGFVRARDFLSSNNRPVEWSLFRYTFENGSKEDVLTALSAHQHECGGFCDLGEGGYEVPTTMATTIAFGYLRELGIDSGNPMIQRGIRFLLNSYDATNEVWPPRPNLTDPITDRLPHA
jgi:hypothetical protein